MASYWNVPFEEKVDTFVEPLQKKEAKAKAEYHDVVEASLKKVLAAPRREVVWSDGRGSGRRALLVEQRPCPLPLYLVRREKKV